MPFSVISSTPFMPAFACARCKTTPKKKNAINRVLRFMRQSETDQIPTGYIDSPNSRLSAAGELMAIEAANDFVPSAARVRMIVSSPMEGAIETAQIFAERLSIPIRKNPYLMEREMGKLPARIDESFFGMLFRPDYHPHGVTPLDEVQKEILTFLCDCASNPYLGLDTLFVTHAIKLSTIISIIEDWEGHKVIPTYKPPDNCEIITFAIGKSCRKCDGFLYEEIRE